MPCQYSIPGNQATTTSALKTAATLVSIAGLRPRLFEFSVGANDAPNATDCAIDAVLQLFTAAGTVTSVTPFPLDPGYQAAKCAAGSNATVEPTYTAASIPWSMSMNQRATYRWVASPNGLITLVGTASNGIGMQVKSSNYGGQTNAHILYEE